MELVQKKPYTFKKFVTIPLSDGSYELERSKIFQCTNLLKHCLQHDKDLSPDKLKSLPKFNNACVKEMDLISKGLDRDLDEDFFDYVQSLSYKDERTFMIAIGKWGEENQKKVYVPSLLAPFVGMILGDIYEKVAHHFSEGNWIHRCYKGVIKENLSSQLIPHFWSENNEKDLGVIRQINGAVNYVPSCLTKEKSVYCGPMQQLVALPIDGQGENWWPTSCSKIVKEWEFRITGTASCGNNKFPSLEEFKNYYLWALNQDVKNTQKILIDKHTENILQVIFSSLGDYALSYSKNEVCVTQIIAQENNQFSFKTKLLCFPGEITAVSAHNKTTAFVVCSHHDAKSYIEFFDSLGNPIIKLDPYDGCVTKGLFNASGDKLLICSEKDASKSMIEIWDTSDLNNIKMVFNQAIETTQKFSLVSCNPHGNRWVVTLLDGGMYFIKECIDGFVAFNVSEQFPNDKNIETMVYTANGLWLITIASQKDAEDNKVSMMRIWSTTKVGPFVEHLIWGLPGGIGITPDNKELVCLAPGFPICKWSFIPEKDEESISHLFNNVTFLRRVALDRLCKACDANEMVEFYEEEPMYKALQTLPKEPQDLVAFVKKHLPYKVINNNKDVAEVYGDAAQACKETSQEIVTAIENWWDALDVKQDIMQFFKR